VLLLEPQRFFERVGVGLVHLEAGVGLANPGLVVVQARLPLAGGDLLDANGYLHGVNVPGAAYADVAGSPAGPP